MSTRPRLTRLGLPGRTCGPATRGAFTLIELVVVIALMAAAVGVAVVRLDGLTQRGRLRAGLRQIAAVHSLARWQAITSGQARSIVYQRGANSCTLQRPGIGSGRWTWVGSVPTVLGHRVTVERIAVEGCPGGSPADDELHRVTVRPDGSCASYVVVVSAGDNRYAAAVIEGLTGRCSCVFDLSRGAVERPEELLGVP